ncbi:unnamed protein product [Symbiodinium natans]|uniref:Uncharacterized protein n=1 Tax=Symbiodinium natans TaxID=878477 RepID=A0A812U0C8_9DINO|nr:unnamed protein product [Symbiodinium natans]
MQKHLTTMPGTPYTLKPVNYDTFEPPFILTCRLLRHSAQPRKFVADMVSKQLRLPDLIRVPSWHSKASKPDHGQYPELSDTALGQLATRLCVKGSSASLRERFWRRCNGQLYKTLIDQFRRSGKYKIPTPWCIPGAMQNNQYRDEADRVLNAFYATQADCNSRREYSKREEFCINFRAKLQIFPSEEERGRFAYALYCRMYDTAGERMNVGTLEAAESFLGAVWELYGPDCPDLLRFFATKGASVPLANVSKDVVSRLQFRPR